MTNRIATKNSSPHGTAECCSDGKSRTASNGSFMQGQVESVAAQLENFVVSRPVIALGVAVAAGITIGWWVKRK